MATVIRLLCSIHFHGIMLACMNENNNKRWCLQCSSSFTFDMQPESKTGRSNLVFISFFVKNVFEI